MMEILFRGKREDNGEWVYGDFYRKFCVTGLVYDYMISTRDGMAYPVIPKTVGQYTGHKDNDGKRIFDGDVVGFADMSSTEAGYYEQSCIGEVIWDKETISFQVTNRLSAESYEVVDDCTVIGNIHDNPELLGGVE